jgi:hypothetical protein
LKVEGLEARDKGRRARRKVIRKCRMREGGLRGWGKKEEREKR